MGKRCGAKGVEDLAVEPRRRAGAGRRLVVTTLGPRLGRIVRVFVEGGFGFIKTARGQLAYFDFADVVGSLGAIEVGARVRYEMASAAMPRAQRVARIG